MFNASSLEKKWEAVLDHKDCTPIKDPYKRATIARLLENTQVALKEERSAQQGFIAESSTTTGNVVGYDPVLISLVRRAMPNIIAYDIAGVQPMTMPTGLIFAMKSLYKTTKAGQTSGQEALHFGDGSPRQNLGPDTAFSGKYTTAEAEALDGAYQISTNPSGFGELGFEIVKTAVAAKSRALRATYTTELAQDLKAVHGLDAESELANILSTEILGEINKEIIDGVKAAAELGGFGASGTFDLVAHSDGRWSVEKYKGLLMQIERDANGIGLDTRRGKANIAIVSANVASAIAAAGMLDYAPALSTSMESDPTGSLFAGTINGKMKVFVNPYTADETVILGYRGTNVYDAGVFYCPYVPLTMMRAIGQDDFQPRIGFKTRYGLRANPFVAADGANSEFGAAGDNFYFRKFDVTNLIGDFEAAS